ncbi:hypothetical protein J2Z37_000487 [Ammoniphilus resinae]|uniref:Putative zinc-finger domain-containing protein n=2 Tax=Ammoniphilus resinae TaxID=861532 RepID=A0ABS4GJQ6_9BACL|nr:hypothetical protein [Ammoniphilus resinae]
MQRNLDKDLSPNELALLEEHLKLCSECQKLNESLQNLSLELEKLPQVEPPVSIVDSILPYLAVQTDGTVAQGTVAQDKKVFPRIRRDWKRYGLMIGTAAAAMFLAISMQNMFSAPERSAEMEQKTANTADHADKVPAVGESRTLSADENTAESSRVEEHTEQSMVGTEPRESLSQPTMEKSSIPNQDAQPSILNPEPPKVHEEAESMDKAGSENAMSGTLKKRVVEEQPLENNGAKDQALALQPLPEEPAIMQNFAAPRLAVPEEGAVSNEKAFKSADTVESKPEVDMQAAKEGVSSPDQRYIAAVEGQMMVVKDQEGKEYFRGHPWGGGGTVTIQWLSPYEFIYVIHFPAYKEQWKVNLPSGQEQKM